MKILTKIALCVARKHGLQSSPTKRPVVLVLAALCGTSLSALAQTVDLGAAANVVVLGGSTVTNTGPTIVTGNLALSPGSSVTGFPPGSFLGGAIHINDALANAAHANAFTAYNQLAGEVSTVNLTGQNLGTLGGALSPGVFHFDTSAQLTGTLRLDSGGNPNAVFHFLIGSTLTTASGASILWVNGSSANIFWQVGSSATIGTGTIFEGNILALSSITLNTGATLNGRALAINGAVTLDSINVRGPIVGPGGGPIGPPIGPGGVPLGRFWNGGASNLWSGTNWSPDATGAITGNLAPGADVVFSVTGIVPRNQNTVLDFDAVISSLTVNDTAAVTISGTRVLAVFGAGAQRGITINRGAGLTTINSPIELSGLSDLVTVSNTAGLVVNGPVSGIVGLTKAGSGDLTLNGVSTYTGQTTVNAGALEVNGSIVGNALVSAGILRGVGRIGGNVVNNAIVNPGRLPAPGTLNIGGNYTQNAVGTLNIRLGSTVIYDRLAIGGGANLNGALAVSYLNGFVARPGDVFTIATTVNGVTNRFATFFDPQATGTALTLGVIYEPRNVLLAFIQASFAGFASTDPCDPNELVVARALDRVAALQPANPLILALDTLPIAQLPAAFALLSPEDLAAAFTAGLSVSRVQVGNIERRLTEVRAGAIGFSGAGFAATDARGTRNYTGTGSRTDGKSVTEVIAPRQDNRWGFFVSGSGEFGDLESTCAARGSSFITAGVTLGVDYRVTNQFVIGAAVGYANTNSDLSRGGSLNMHSGKASIYATAYSGGFYVNALAGAGYGSYRTKRLTLGGFANGETNGADFNVLLGTGYDIKMGAFTVGPVASIEYATIRLDGFTESGAIGALRIQERSQASLKSAVGLRAAYAAKLGSVIFTPEVRVQWQHQFRSDTSRIDAAFVVGPAFSVNGPRIGRDSLVLDAGASAQISSRFALFAFYRGEGGHTNYTSHSINGGFRVSF